MAIRSIFIVYKIIIKLHISNQFFIQINIILFHYVNEFYFVIHFISVFGWSNLLFQKI